MLSGPKPHVLLVEDDEDLREILVENLSDLGCQCDTAIDGLGALEILKEEKYTCVISDIQMPNLDGMEMLKAIRLEGIDVPIILITGYSEYTDDLVTSQGAAVVIHKPFKFEQIKEIVEEYIELFNVA